jgi:UDP-3-O-acyl N-acetylglucosamine deacetylase
MAREKREKREKRNAGVGALRRVRFPFAGEIRPVNALNSVRRMLKTPVAVRGVGLHSGTATTALLRPGTTRETVLAASRTGRYGWGAVFVRTDLPGTPVLTLADVDEKAPPLRTVLRNETAEVHTVEHLLAVLAGLQVGPVTVELDGPEPPGLDGSALPWAEALWEHLGPPESVPADLDRPLLLAKPVKVTEGEAEIEAFPDEAALCLDYALHYPDEPLAQGRLALTITPDVFLRELAPARTFCLRKEADALRAAGFGRGAGPENTLVLENGRSLTCALRFPDEPVRHKMADLLGDLFLLGRPLRARITARRSGHRLNRALVRALLQAEARP